MQQNKLFIDVSTNLCSVMLQKKEVLIERNSSGRGIHSEDLFRHIQSVCDEAEITVSTIESVFLTAGPGSYTGLRIGASAVKGLVFGREKTVKVYQMHTLPVFAMKTAENYQHGKIHAVMNARRKHLFHQSFTFNSSGVLVSDQEKAEILRITEVEEMVAADDIMTGTGLERLDETIRSITTLDPIEEDSTAALMKKLLENQLNIFEIAEESPFIEKVEPETFEPYYYSPGHTQVQRT